MSSARIKFTDLNSLPTYESASTSRLQSLYADISRQKHSNTASYHSTIYWWRQTIQFVMLKSWLSQSPNHLVLHASPSLADSFRYEGVGKPLCLATVIAELRDAKAYIPLHQFLSSVQSVYDTEWLPLRVATYLVGKPLWWALKQLNVVESDEGSHHSDVDRWKRVQGDYILLDLLESAAQAVISHQRATGSVTLTDRLYTVDTFRIEFASVALSDKVLSDLDIKLLVKYLERDIRVVCVEKEVIKFIDEDSIESRTITAVDQGLAELKAAIRSLQSQVDNIQQKILGRTNKATAALQQRQKDLALSHLRSRRQLEDLFRKRIQALENLETTLLSVERAAGDVEIMKTYESSTATLRSILSHPLLQHDKIDETMDAMFSATQDAKDVDETIHLAGDMGHQFVDEDELEEELKALVQEAERQKAEVADGLEVERQQRERDSVHDALQRSTGNRDDSQQVKRDDEDSHIRDELAVRNEASIGIV